MKPDDITPGLYLGDLGTIFRVEEVTPLTVKYRVEGFRQSLLCSMPKEEFCAFTKAKLDDPEDKSR